MRNCLFPLSCLIFSSVLFAQQTGKLYQWETSSGKIWKTFGEEAAQLKYEGEIKNDEPDGLGVSSYHGTSFIGKWKEGKKHGQGIFTYTSGKIEEGTWEKDKLITSK